MNILAIESSCDETAVAVVCNGRQVLSDCISSQVDIHKIYGGVVPEIASRKHIEAIYPLADQALLEAGLTRREIDAVAVTYAPGLSGAVLVGVNFAKAAAFALGKPLIPVHHIRGHIAANYLTHPELEPPFLCLVVSGGHTMLVDVEDYTKMTILGGTRDDAAGECFDKIARVLGMPYPGGAALDRTSRGGDETKYSLPRARVDGNPLDLSFSGLKTAAINLIHNAQQKNEAIDVPALCASVSAAVSGALVSRTELALEQTGRRTLAVAGGVAANSRIRADIDAVAVTYAPGLIGAVLVGVNFAKAAAFAMDRPLIPVHHIRGHIAANYITHPDLEPPFLCLVVSGGHTMLVDVADYTDMRILGGTRDDAAGECFDKIARVLDMPYPGGAALDRRSQDGDETRYPLPRAKVDGNPLDLSFSGLKTAAINLIHNAQQRDDKIDVPSLCASVSASVSEALVSRTALALEQTGRKTLAVAGGVAANSRIRAEVTDLARRLGVRLCLPELRYCGDNAAMIGAQGYYEYLAGNTADMTLNAYATKSLVGETL